MRSHILSIASSLLQAVAFCFFMSPKKFPYSWFHHFLQGHKFQGLSPWFPSWPSLTDCSHQSEGEGSCYLTLETVPSLTSHRKKTTDFYQTPVNLETGTCLLLTQDFFFFRVQSLKLLKIWLRSELCLCPVKKVVVLSLFMHQFMWTVGKKKKIIHYRS